jgi:hypothetical protein
MCGFFGAIAEWLKTYESVAIWLEGIALILILGLDWRERIDQRKERQEQHKETAAQLSASQKQVEAAIKSADAATTSANAAQESLRLMRHQLEEQAGLGQSVLQSAIETAISAIQFWKGQDLPKLANMRGLPPTDNLAPQDISAALDHARKIDLSAAQQVSSAFDDLQSARLELKIMREIAPGRIMGPAFYDPKCNTVTQHLNNAFEKLQKAQATLLLPRPRRI